MRITTPYIGNSSTLIDPEPQLGGRLCQFPSPWCTSPGKRIFDIFLSTMVLIAALPLMLLASLGVVTSRGPIFFACHRVGQGRKPIRVLKFRTMLSRKDLGVQLTRRGDDRVTKAGRFLRAWKIDELPQLLNVIRGDMSLVGPRPDSAEFLNTLPAHTQLVLSSVKPGLTSIASMVFRDEEGLLSRVPENDLTSYYVNTLLPEKISLDLEYASRAGMFSDLKILLGTLLAVVR